RGAEVLARGTVYANLTVERTGSAPAVRINEPVLSAVLTTLGALKGKVEAAPATLDGILALKGVIEVTEADEREDDRRACGPGGSGARTQARGCARAPCRAAGGAARRVRALRPRPPAPGSDPDRGQGRHPRGARSARFPCGAGAKAGRRRRRGRPPSRFSGAGAQSRIEYVVR